MVRMPKVPDGWFDANSESEKRGDASVTNSQSDGARIARNERAGQQAAAPKPANPIGPVKGYPEMGRDAWRTGNDDVTVAAADKYNSEHGYFSGDADYMTPQLMKAWMMRESGGNRHAFETDPFQVNKRKDWAPEKTRIAGLKMGQTMTPSVSAEAALKWARHKSGWPGLESTSPLARKAHYGTYEALRNYNGSADKSDYANDIMNRAWTSYGDWQK